MKGNVLIERINRYIKYNIRSFDRCFHPGSELRGGLERIKSWLSFFPLFLNQFRPLSRRIGPMRLSFAAGLWL